MSDIKAGDVVEIKSGGPRMVVVSDVEDESSVPTVWVQWFADSDSEFHAHRVAVICLKKHDDQA